MRLFADGIAAPQSQALTVGLSRRARLILRASAVAGVAGLAFHVAHALFGLGGHGADKLANDWVYDGVILGGAVSCLMRAAVVRENRLAWTMLGAGLAFDAFGEIYYSLAFGDSGTPPTPSFADLLYLLWYPCAYVGLLLLVRAQTERLQTSTWVDGAIAAATAAAVVAAVAFEPILHSATQGDAAATVTNLAYPIGDLILIVLVVCMFALSGWRPGRSWVLLGAGLLFAAFADTSYLYQSAKGTYVVGGVLDSMWVASALSIGFAAWQRGPGRVALRLEGRRLLAIPAVCALASLGVLLYGGFHHVSGTGLALAGGAVMLVFIRAGWTFHENVVLLEASRRDASTDALTGLGNRRAMTAALDRVLSQSPERSSGVLVMFDLDGFKLYNDRFGHVAGDTMLRHLGMRLRDAVTGVGEAFRLGGDEFCVILHTDPRSAEPHIAAAVAALSATGEEFSVGTSYGQVALPGEANTQTLALKIADDRMYAQKGGRRGSARQQTHDVLLGVLREREPGLHLHVCEVGRLAVLVGRRLGLGVEELDVLRRAAELHDVGKAAIPDAILSKPGALNDDEWEFMRRHTLVGERILAAAPALAPVAAIVRSGHERWDGGGYPDGLAGEQIPLGSRVVFVCDAFHAMTGGRPYAAALSAEEALAELRRTAGKQFDPAVVQAFEAVWAEGDVRPGAHDELDHLVRG